MLSKSRKQKIDHYKVENVVYMKDFLVWRRLQKEAANKTTLRKFCVIVLIAAFSTVYILGVMDAINKTNFKKQTKIESTNKGE